MSISTSVLPLVLSLLLAFLVHDTTAQIGNVAGATTEALRRCSLKNIAELNCTALVNSWVQAYIAGNFANFFAQPYVPTLFATRPGQALFWSGTYVFTHTYDANGNNVYFPGRVTLEDTVGGSIFNGLDGNPWGLRYDASNQTSPSNTAPFWGKASELYADYASGSVFVALGGRSPFRTGSIFESVESYRLAQKFANDPNLTISVIVFPYSIFTGYQYSNGACISGTPSGSIATLFARFNASSSSRLGCTGLSTQQLSLLQAYCNTTTTDLICSTNNPDATTVAPTTAAPTTAAPTTAAPTTAAPTTAAPTTAAPCARSGTVININFEGIFRGFVSSR
eukprot:TRINITY_DN2026_c0_g1_i4.p1 TRINITY_DN2026_c0_g1~~TRINITY_DN2026_c0_g1_i4.p1  ORF type:complete len:338 (-),score=92.63 TRINITY_DN2026_c0_g1_i4:179-1192(-)